MTKEMEERLEKIVNDNNYKIIKIENKNKNAKSAIIHYIDKQGYKYKCTVYALFKQISRPSVDKRNIYTIDNIKKILKDKQLNCELISTNYVKQQNELIFKCGLCGNTYSRLWNNQIKSTHGFCRNCQAKINPTGVFIDHARIIKQHAKENNFTILGFENDNSAKGYIKFQDSNGYKFKQTFSDFKKGLKPNIVYKSNPYTNDNIKNFISLNFEIQSNFIYCDYKNIGSKVKLRCHCGKTYERIWNSIQGNKTKILECVECGYKRRGAACRQSKNDVFSILDKSGYSYNIEDYVSASEKMTLTDKEGYKYFVAPIQVKRSLNQTTFFNGKYFDYNLNLFFSKYSGDCKLIKSYYLGKVKYVDILCKCGKVHARPLNYVTINKRFLCRDCSKNISSFEKLVNQLLEDYNVKYTSHAHVNINDGNFKWIWVDYLFKDINKAIEVNGQQHYSFIPYIHKTIERFERQVERDKICQKYCDENGIKLLWINYKDILNGKYKEIIKDFLKL